MMIFGDLLNMKESFYPKKNTQKIYINNKFIIYINDQ